MLTRDGGGEGGREGGGGSRPEASSQGRSSREGGRPRTSCI